MKKMLVLLLALVMVLSAATMFAGCEKAADDQGATEAETKTTTQATETEATEDTQQVEVTTAEATQSATEEEAEPVPLSQLEVVSEENGYRKGDITDSYGNEYTGPHFEFVSYGQNSQDGKFITQSYTDYSVAGQYHYFTGKYFTRSGQEEDAEIELMIYADEQLVYYSGPITRRTKVTSFAVDIGNCDVLRVVSRSYDYSGATNPGMILVDAYVMEHYDGELTEGAYLNTDLTALTDLHIYSQDCSIAAGGVEDTYGNSYKGIYLDLCSWGGNNPRNAQASFVANGEYKYLSGTIFTRTEQAESYTIEFKVYADDELIYSSGPMSRSSKAVDFCVDITDCEMIRVETTSSDHTNSGTNPGVILMNPAVSQEKP